MSAAADAEQALQLAYDRRYWLGVANARPKGSRDRRRALMWARAIEDRIIVLAIKIEHPGVRQETPPVSKIAETK